MVNRFNSDLNMSESPRLIRIAYLLTAVDMQLPNHAVNTMYIAMRILGSVVLLVIAGKYVNTRHGTRFLSLTIDDGGRSCDSHCDGDASTVLRASWAGAASLGFDNKVTVSTSLVDAVTR